MAPGIFSIVLKSIKYYRKPVVYQVLIIALLSAVITGSLLTGYSVRMSLKKSAADHIGNSGIVVSSGLRYFDNDITGRIRVTGGLNCTGLIEITGSSQNLSSQKDAFNTHIYGIKPDFFSFHGKELVSLNSGEIAINRRLADHLEAKKGDDIIIRFTEISDIPSDAPFAPDKADGHSVVKKIAEIIEPENGGNFSLSISQLVPMNIFINLDDIGYETGKSVKINRLIIEKNSNISIEKAGAIIKSTLRFSDIGLRIRKLVRTEGFELISDRIFIDEPLVKEVANRISSAPVITYLSNKIESDRGSTPYSFVSALPPSLYPEITQGNEIVINTWLAEDLATKEGDTLSMFWYAPDSLNRLIECRNDFVVRKIVETAGIWADSLLMPDFPGIAGSESCSDWDAGVPIKMDRIRDKDEDYWNKFKGTPKAFIGYGRGKELWGSNFGPATAIRFPSGTTESEIEESLNGSLEPDLSGFMITDLYGEAIKAAEESVDFGTLFISLGFFLILASIVLLSFAVSFYFDTKRGQINTLFALGFNNRWIKKILLQESLVIGIGGSMIGAFTGFLVSIGITLALNSVWKGAVQTNTLSAYFGLKPVITGFIVTLTIMMTFMVIKTGNYLKSLNRKEKEPHKSASSSGNFRLLIVSLASTIVLFSFSFVFVNQEIMFSFGAGAILLLTSILFWRQFYTGGLGFKAGVIKQRMGLSRLYYSFNPSHAVTPTLFIAAGIFAVFITLVNRKDFDEDLLKNSSGTGGYLLWFESNIPVSEELNTLKGRTSLGLDDDSLSSMRFTQIKRLQGNDASCLNLNHITAPPLMGVDPGDFIKRKSFSFAKHLKQSESENPWEYLKIEVTNSTIYGIADQTVLEWGLKISVGDTLIMRAESGQRLNIIIAAGLQSSVFQGYVIIGKENFAKYFPSVSGNSVMLVSGNPELTEKYKIALNERLSNNGIYIEKTSERLASFYEVTNTYLSVFGVFGALGMITGIAGMGFVLLRNFNSRRREFALMLATGYSFRQIRRIIINEQVVILLAGVSSGIISAIVATFPSLSDSHSIPWLFLSGMVVTITLTGLMAIILSVRSISGDSLITALKKD
jgi:putative ABC transport system permease protein